MKKFLLILSVSSLILVGFMSFKSYQIYKSNAFLKSDLTSVSGHLKQIEDSLLKMKLAKDSLPKINPFFYRTSCFMGGVLPDDFDRKDSLFKSVEWNHYAMKIEENWDKFEKNKLNVVDNWVKENLSSISKESKDVFYPFSGPDFNYCWHFFPNAERYVFIGMEPVGKIPSIEKLQKDSLMYFFNALNQAIHASLDLSYFITIQMKTQLRSERINGTIPIFMFFLARNDLMIENICPAEIDTSGKIIVRDTALSKRYNANKSFRTGVEFTCYKKNNKKPFKLYYFQLNLNNQGVDGSKIETAFLSNYKNCVTTFIKSASFLMHSSNFDKIRKMILSKSRFVIQDDSGIPFALYDSLKWDRHFYGTYIPPIPMFKRYFQGDLNKNFKSSIALPFKFGYSPKPGILVMTPKNYQGIK